MKMEDSYEPLVVEETNDPAPYFVLEGTPFCFQGTNNYYLDYKPAEATLDVLDAARAMNLTVLRTWAFHDRGSLDGRMPNARDPGHHDGVYFQYWDPNAARPAYHDGPNGLERLDFVLHEARQRDLKLILVLTNSWRDFGGMDQYLIWYGLDKHHLFFTDERVKKAYKDWVAHLVNRVNAIDGTPYKDDPAIFAWELANEPRTMTFGDFDSPDGWDSSTITNWANEMSSFIKSMDQNHMVAVGDEGFLASGGEGWAYETPYGVDNEALTALPAIDFGTYHLYPDHWGSGHRWGNQWILDHIAVARRVNKPNVLEEYGIHIRREHELSGKLVDGWERRKVAYTNWNNLIMKQGGSGAMFWILSGYESPGKLYPDYDHFTIYQGDESAALVGDYARRMPDSARACVLAREVHEETPSPFVQARGAPNPRNASLGKSQKLPTRLAALNRQQASMKVEAQIWRAFHALTSQRHQVPLSHPPLSHPPLSRTLLPLSQSYHQHPEY